MITRTKSSLRLDYECPCRSKNIKVLHYKVRYTTSEHFILSFSDVSAIITPINSVVTTSDTYTEMKLCFLQSAKDFRMMLTINKNSDLLFFVTYNQRVFCEVGTEFHNSER